MQYSVRSGDLDEQVEVDLEPENGGIVEAAKLAVARFWSDKKPSGRLLGEIIEVIPGEPHYTLTTRVLKELGYSEESA